MKNKIKFAIVGCRNIAPFHADAIKDIDNAELTGHAPSFWNEIDGDLKPTARDEYPKGPI